MATPVVILWEKGGLLDVKAPRPGMMDDRHRQRNLTATDKNPDFNSMARLR